MIDAQMLIFKMRALVRPIILKHRGEVINLIADDFVAVFPTAECCLTAGVEARRGNLSVACREMRATPFPGTASKAARRWSCTDAIAAAWAAGVRFIRV